MASFTERVSVLIDVTGDKAVSSLGNIKSKIGEAEGAAGKLKAAAGGVGDILQANVAAAAAGAGAAVAKFVGDSIGKFNDLATKSGDLATQMGTSVENASRWVEVADDLGVSADAIGAAAGRLNREAASGALAKYGIDAADSNERLLQTLDYLQTIPDEADRAKVQFELLGKGGAALTPLIGRTKELRDRLADVSDQKIIDDEELQKSRDYADAVDNLTDVWGDFQNEIGGDVIPALATLLTTLGDVWHAVDDLAGAIPGVDGGLIGLASGPLRNVSDGFSTLTDSSSTLTERAKGLGQAITGAIPGPLGNWGAGLFDVKGKSDDAASATDDLTESALAAADAAAAEAEELQKLADKFLSGAALTLHAEEQQRKLSESLQSGAIDVDNLKGQFVSFAQTLEKQGGNPAAIDGLSRLKLLVAPGSELDRYLDQLIAGLKNVDETSAEGHVKVAGAAESNADMDRLNKSMRDFDGSTATGKATLTLTSSGTAGASGRPFVPPGFPTHGAAVPGEAQTVGAGAGARGLGAAGDTVAPASTLARSSAPAGNTTVIYNAPPGVNPADVVRVLNRWTASRGVVATSGATGL